MVGPGATLLSAPATQPADTGRGWAVNGQVRAGTGPTWGPAMPLGADGSQAPAAGYYAENSRILPTVIWVTWAEAAGDLRQNHSQIRKAGYD